MPSRSLYSPHPSLAMLAAFEANAKNRTGKTIEEWIEPADLVEALVSAPAAKEVWEKLPPSHRREHIEAINEAKKPQTRARRIARVIETLAKPDGKKR